MKIGYLNNSTGNAEEIGTNGATPYINSTTNTWWIAGADTGIRVNGICTVTDYTYLPTTSADKDTYLALNDVTVGTDSYKKGLYSYDLASAEWVRTALGSEADEVSIVTDVTSKKIQTKGVMDCISSNKMFQFTITSDGVPRMVIDDSVPAPTP